MRKTPSAPVAFWKQTDGAMERICTLSGPLAGIAEASLAEMDREGSSAEPVRVLEVDEAAASRWKGKNPPVPTVAEAVTEGQLFTSALAASRALGFPYNYVGVMLSKERKRMKADLDKRTKGRAVTASIRPKVTIRGVTLQYEQDVRA